MAFSFPTFFQRSTEPVPTASTPKTRAPIVPSTPKASAAPVAYQAQLEALNQTNDAEVAQKKQKFAKGTRHYIAGKTKGIFQPKHTDKAPAIRFGQEWELDTTQNFVSLLYAQKADWLNPGKIDKLALAKVVWELKQAERNNVPHVNKKFGMPTTPVGREGAVQAFMDALHLPMSLDEVKDAAGRGAGHYANRYWPLLFNNTGSAVGSIIPFVAADHGAVATLYLLRDALAVAQLATGMMVGYQRISTFKDRESAAGIMVAKALEIFSDAPEPWEAGRIGKELKKKEPELRRMLNETLGPHADSVDLKRILDQIDDVDDNVDHIKAHLYNKSAELKGSNRALKHRSLSNIIKIIGGLATVAAAHGGPVASGVTAVTTFAVSLLPHLAYHYSDAGAKDGQDKAIACIENNLKMMSQWVNTDEITPDEIADLYGQYMEKKAAEEARGATPKERAATDKKYVAALENAFKMNVVPKMVEIVGGIHASSAEKLLLGKMADADRKMVAAYKKAQKAKENVNVPATGKSAAAKYQAAKNEAARIAKDLGRLKKAMHYLDLAVKYKAPQDATDEKTEAVKTGLLDHASMAMLAIEDDEIRKLLTSDSLLEQGCIIAKSRMLSKGEVLKYLLSYGAGTVISDLGSVGTTIAISSVDAHSQLVSADSAAKTYYASNIASALVAPTSYAMSGQRPNISKHLGGKGAKSHYDPAAALTAPTAYSIAEAQGKFKESKKPAVNSSSATVTAKPTPVNGDEEPAAFAVRMEREVAAYDAVIANLEMQRNTLTTEAGAIATLQTDINNPKNPQDGYVQQKRLIQQRLDSLQMEVHDVSDLLVAANTLRDGSVKRLNEMRNAHSEIRPSIIVLTPLEVEHALNNAKYHDIFPKLESACEGGSSPQKIDVKDSIVLNGEKKAFDYTLDFNKTQPLQDERDSAQSSSEKMKRYARNTWAAMRIGFVGYRAIFRDTGKQYLKQTKDFRRELNRQNGEIRKRVQRDTFNGLDSVFKTPDFVNTAIADKWTMATLMDRLGLQLASPKTKNAKIRAVPQNTVSFPKIEEWINREAKANLHHFILQAKDGNFFTAERAGFAGYNGESVWHVNVAGGKVTLEAFLQDNEIREIGLISHSWKLDLSEKLAQSFWRQETDPEFVDHGSSQLYQDALKQDFSEIFPDLAEEADARPMTPDEVRAAGSHFGLRMIYPDLSPKKIEQEPEIAALIAKAVRDPDTPFDRHIFLTPEIEKEYDTAVPGLMSLLLVPERLSVLHELQINAKLKQTVFNMLSKYPAWLREVKANPHLLNRMIAEPAIMQDKNAKDGIRKYPPNNLPHPDNLPSVHGTIKDAHLRIKHRNEKPADQVLRLSNKTAAYDHVLAQLEQRRVDLHESLRVNAIELGVVSTNVTGSGTVYQTEEKRLAQQAAEWRKQMGDVDALWLNATAQRDQIARQIDRTLALYPGMEKPPGKASTAQIKQAEKNAKAAPLPQNYRSFDLNVTNPGSGNYLKSMMSRAKHMAETPAAQVKRLNDSAAGYEAVIKQIDEKTRPSLNNKMDVEFLELAKIENQLSAYRTIGTTSKIYENARTGRLAAIESVRQQIKSLELTRIKAKSLLAHTDQQIDDTIALHSGLQVPPRILPVREDIISRAFKKADAVGIDQKTLESGYRAVWMQSMPPVGNDEKSSGAAPTPHSSAPLSAEKISSLKWAARSLFGSRPEPEAPPVSFTVQSNTDRIRALTAMTRPIGMPSVVGATAQRHSPAHRAAMLIENMMRENLDQTTSNGSASTKQLHEMGIVRAETRGKENRLILSLLQHATGNYDQKGIQLEKRAQQIGQELIRAGYSEFTGNQVLPVNSRGFHALVNLINARYPQAKLDVRVAQLDDNGRPFIPSEGLAERPNQGGNPVVILHDGAGRYEALHSRK